MIRNVSAVRKPKQLLPGTSPCDHRTVSKDGRINCAKIVSGDNAVSPELCYACPVRAVNCTHLSFSLKQISPNPIVVRFNGRTEVWDDDPPEILFEQAACAAQVIPIHGPRSCAGCALRQPVDAVAAKPAPRRRQAEAAGKVVPFPGRRAVAATG